MIVSTPLNLPPLKPTNWELWWEIWKNHAAPLVKRVKNHNQESSVHFGFEFIRNNFFSTVYKANYVDLRQLDRELYEQVMSLPIKIFSARLLQSLADFPPHTDNRFTSWAIRSMLFCEDPETQWYYTDLNNQNKKYLKLPQETNWWAYLDGAIKHGTTYKESYPKIILQLFTERKATEEFVRRNFDSFPDYCIRYNSD